MIDDPRTILRVLIADDELLARKRARRLLSSMERVEIVAECENGAEVVKMTRALRPDVLLLDIRMPEVTGLEAKALLDGEDVFVIFATAHPEHAVDAFDVGAVDYVLKPIEASRLNKAIERARRYVRDRHLDATRAVGMKGDGQAATPAAERHPTFQGVEGDLDGTLAPLPGRGPGADRVAIATKAGVRLLPAGEISHATFDGTLVTVHCHGERILTELSLNDLAARVPAGLLLRVHRRALLNLDFVDRLVPRPTGGYVAVLRDGAKVEVSRQSARQLRRRFALG